MPSVNSEEKLYLAAKEQVALFWREDVLLFSAEGPDLERYLQGRITQDVKSLASGNGAASLLLNPQGKIQGHFQLLKSDTNELFLIADKTKEETAAEDFLKALLQFKVADQLSIDEVANTQVASLVGPKAEATLSALGLALPADDAYAHVCADFQGSEIRCVRRPAGITEGIDLLYPAECRAALEQAMLEHDVTFGDSAVSETAWSMLRIDAGIPHQLAELGEKTSATEIPYQSLISFSKGCYAGQEVVEMSIARGRPNKELVQLQASPGSSLQVGDAIVDQDSGKECGSITSVCHLPPEGVLSALGFVKAKFLDKQEFLAGDVLLKRKANSS